MRRGIACLLFGCALLSAQAPKYRAVLVGPPGTGTAALGLSENGWVTGYAWNGTAGFRWRDGNYEALDLPSTGNVSFFPYAINNNGDVAGTWQNRAFQKIGVSPTRFLDSASWNQGSQVGLNESGFVSADTSDPNAWGWAVWNAVGGVVRTKGGSNPAPPESMSRGLNASGQTAGTIREVASQSTRGVRRNLDGTYAPIDHLFTGCSAWVGTVEDPCRNVPGGPAAYYRSGINDAGQVIGVGRWSDRRMRGYRWSGPGTLTAIPTFCPNNLCTVTDLQGGADSVPTAIARTGSVTGWALDGAGVRQAFLMRVNGTMVKLTNNTACSTSLGHDVNASDEVVGLDCATGAMFWRSGIGYRLEDLAPLPTGLSRYDAPLDINDNGWIAGYGFVPGGSTQAYLLIPQITATITSNIPGRTILVDGSPVVTPAVLEWDAGSTHTLTAVSPQGTGDSRFTWTSWSNSGAQTQTVTVGRTAVSFTANFATQHKLTVITTSGGTVGISPPSVDGFYNLNTNVTLTSTVQAGFAFGGYSGALTGLTTRQAVRMDGPKTVTASFVCTYSLSPSSASFTHLGGGGTFDVITGASCTWAPVSTVPWLSIVSGGGMGNGRVVYAAALNPNPATRSAVIPIGTGGFTVNQAAAPIPAPPSSTSVTPTASSGKTLVMTAIVTDPNGAENLKSVRVSIGNAGVAAGQCRLLYTRVGSTVQVQDDSGSAWGPPEILGTAVTRGNAQCSVNVAGMLAVSSGNVLFLTIPLTAGPSFAGFKDLSVAADDQDGLASGETRLGSWLIPETGIPVASSVTPSSGTGSSVSLRAVYTDVGGGAQINTAHVLLNSGLDPTGGCWVMYNATVNGLFLVADNGVDLIGPVTPGGVGSVVNNLCTLQASTSSVARSATSLTLTFGLQFAPGNAGARDVWMMAVDNDGRSSGWVRKGKWTVP